jgi:hypothetical protein
MPILFKPFKHEPILENSDDIRLIRLIAPDTIEIFHAPLKDVPKYRALSYVWGTEDCQAPLHVSIGGQALHQLNIKHNCMEAILRLYQDDPKTPVWIDAICIDQTNILERNHQVQRMDQIYCSAEKVQIFLGGPSDPSNEPWLKFLDNLASFNRPGSTTGMSAIEIINSPSYQKSIQRLLDSPYFSRRWVLQEVYCARRVEILCWRDVLPWDVFLHFQSLASLDLLYQKVTLLDSQNEWARMPAAITSVQPGRVFCDFGEDLVDLINMTLELDSSEEVDTVYALLGLLGEEKRMVERKPLVPNLSRKLWMRPDYGKNVVELKNEILENEWKCMWKWLGIESWLPEHTEALSDGEGRPKSIEEALHYLLRIADQSHTVFTDVSRVWWWVYGAKLDVLKNESAELAMKIRVAFPFAGDLKGSGVFREDPMFAEAADASKRLLRTASLNKRVGRCDFPFGHPLYVEVDSQTMGLARVYSSHDLDSAPGALSRFRKLVQLRFDLSTRYECHNLSYRLIVFDARLTGLSDSLQQRVDANSERDTWTEDEKAEFEILRRRFIAHFEMRPAEMQDASLFEQT